MSEDRFEVPEQPTEPRGLWRGRSRRHRVRVVLAAAALLVGGLALVLACLYLVPRAARYLGATTRLARGAPREALVRLAEGEMEVTVASGSEGTWKQGPQDAARAIDAGKGPWRVEATAGGFRINGRSFAGSRLSFAGSESVFLFNDRAFRGRLTLFNSGGAMRAVNALDLEQYLVSVVGSEMPSHWPADALMAQAVAARSFAIYRLGERRDWNYNLSRADLAYRGVEGECVPSRRAVEQTRGQIIRYRGELFPVFFHSTCGGRTASAEKVFAEDPIPPLAGVTCGWCSDSPVYTWQKKISQNELTRALSGRVSGVVRSIELSGTEPHGWPRFILVNGQKMDANRFRLAVGAGVLKSTAFTVTKRGDTFVFFGRGWGHGVGLCQWGARGLAADGRGWREILRYYYPSIEFHAVY